MTSEKKDYYGKEVTDAIKTACKELQVPQEQLEIEIIETGSTGIFGLIRKKAHILARIREVQAESVDEIDEGDEIAEGLIPKESKDQVKPEPKQAVEEVKPESIEAVKEKEEQSVDSTQELHKEEDVTKKEDKSDEKIDHLSDESLEQIRQELLQMLELMGYSSSVEISASGTSVTCRIGEEFAEILTGVDGKTLDSLQYLLRKIVTRKVLHRIRLTVDVGNYREKRLTELKDRAIKLAEKVKTDGKTQVIPALSPSERRVVHMSLQDDKEIRSRSVGDGLFKKILIYKPGKGNKAGGRKRGNSRGRKPRNPQKKGE